MPISFPISLPAAPVPKGISIRPRSVVGIDASPFTLQAQSYAWRGQQWQASVQQPPMTRAAAEAWVAALISLNGAEGSFLLGDSANTAPRGAGTGVPLVNGGGQTGTDLITDGWTASVTGILKAGDWVQLGTGNTARLYKQLVDVNSNGLGQATLTLWPALRSSPADNAALVVNSAKGRFMLAQPLDYNIDDMKIYGLGFEAVEDLRP